MTEPEASDIDRRLRVAFGNDAAAAARVARIALSEDEARGRGLAQAVLADDEVPASRLARFALTVDDAGDGRFDRRAAPAKAPGARRRWAAVAAAGAAVLLVASALVFWPAPPLPEPGTEAPGSQWLLGSISDGALIVSLPDGSTSISWGAARDDRPPDGSGIVIVEGVIK